MVNQEIKVSGRYAVFILMQKTTSQLFFMSGRWQSVLVKGQAFFPTVS